MPKITEEKNKQSLKLQAYEYLKTKILNCEYAPREMLNEQGLCEEMGNISRTPMRDALGRLEQEGLIKILPKKGLMVADITKADVNSIYEVRLVVEPYAMRTYGGALSREKLEAFYDTNLHHPWLRGDTVRFSSEDDLLHEYLVSPLQNQFLKATYDNITGLNSRFRIMLGRRQKMRIEETYTEHLAILDACLAGDFERAADALSHHLEMARLSAFESVRDMSDIQ